MPEELEEEVKAAAEISMGTEVSESDLSNISSLCEQVSARTTLGPLPLPVMLKLS